MKTVQIDNPKDLHLMNTIIEPNQVKTQANLPYTYSDNAVEQQIADIGNRHWGMSNYHV